MALLFAFSAAFSFSDEPRTERHYLSGHGPKDAVPWEFSVTGGRRAGEKATIPVPSNWELHGFGAYHYGQQKIKSDEHGLYRTHFAVPPEWDGRRIWLVFEGVMTGCSPTLNGRALTPPHEGGFYRFRYDVTKLVKFGSDASANVLDVDVAKVSADSDTEGAERNGDYWVFGGIYRPVWLEATPAQAIDHVAIDARADGTISTEVTLSAVREADRIDAQVLDASGRITGGHFGTLIPKGGTGRLWITGRIDSPRLWTAETPNLYTLRLSLKKGDETLHIVDQRFGFRTFEVRDGQGLFVNGQRVLLKGVNRHSFRPETGRALDPEDCYNDVRLIREMNMNAVRMSHYPPDEAFLDACDELGLYVLDELSGWHHAHDTANGRRLVREMVERDVNHPAIVFWDNGNEGGNNRDLDGDFALYDPQHRRVLHPWELFSGLNTKHYPNYDDFVALLRGPNVVMPTEFLHGMYDGGAGAGLDDYWRAISASPVGGGGFIWVFADEGVVRSDQGGRVDVFSTFAPDGIVGPHHEKEGSFYTIREIWSPVQIDTPKLDAALDEGLVVHNRYDFTSLAQCRFSWQLLKFDPLATPVGAANTVAAQGEVTGPSIAAHADGRLALGLPAGWREADALAVTAISPVGEKLWTWTWALPGLATRVAGLDGNLARVGTTTIIQAPDAVTLRVGDISAIVDATSGLLREVKCGGATIPISAGPRLAYARPPADAVTEWLPFADSPADGYTKHLLKPALANVVEVEVDDLHGADALSGFKLEISPDGLMWNTLFDATRRPQDGTRYEFPPQIVSAVRLINVRRYDGRPPVLKLYRTGYAASRFPTLPKTPAKITTGIEKDPTKGESVWLEAQGGPSGLNRLRWTLRGDGTLDVQYAYSLEGRFIYHGVTFDYPDDQIASFRWLGQGPYRVWQNRLRGTTLGVHEHSRHITQPGESWEYPEYEGFFAGVRWTRFATKSGAFSITAPGDGVDLRVGTPRVSAATTTVDFPAGDISFMDAIPAIGSKGKPPERAGPASQPATAHGQYGGELIFRFEAR